MSTTNSVRLFGNLGADPEYKVTSGGQGLLKLRVATNERVKKGEEWIDHTEWHSVTCFGKRAEGLARILSKGSKVLVDGKLRTSSYEKDGEKRYRTEIIADDIVLGGGVKKSSNDEEPEEFAEVGDSEIPF